MNIDESDLTLCRGEEIAQTVQEMMNKMSEQLSASGSFVKKGTKAYLNYQNLIEKLK